MYRNVPNAKIGNSHERPKRVNGRRAPLGRLTWSLLNVPKRLSARCATPALSLSRKALTGLRSTRTGFRSRFRGAQLVEKLRIEVDNLGESLNC